VSVNPFESGVAAQVVVPPVGDRILAALGSGLASQAGPLLGPLVRALAAELAEVSQLVAEGRGVEALFNLDESPVPGWLGQWVGLDYDPRLPLEQQRAQVRSRGVTRGTPAAMLSAVLALIGTADGAGGVTDRNVQLIERTAEDGSPAAYRFVVQVYAAQAGDAANLDAIRAAVAAVKPVGLVWALRVLPGWTYDDALSRGGVYDDEISTTITYDDDSRTVPNTAGLARYSDETSATVRYISDTLRSYDRDLAAD